MKRFFAVVLMLAMLLSCAAMAESAVLKVRGSGVVSVSADVARVVLGVREQSDDVRAAQASVNEKIPDLFDNWGYDRLLRRALKARISARRASTSMQTMITPTARSD